MHWYQIFIVYFLDSALKYKTTCLIRLSTRLVWLFNPWILVESHQFNSRTNKLVIHLTVNGNTPLSFNINQNTKANSLTQLVVLMLSQFNHWCMLSSYTIIHIYFVWLPHTKDNFSLNNINKREANIQQATSYHNKYKL
jgi:hypothetical protein